MRLCPKGKTTARALRRNLTAAEDVLWQALRNRQLGGLKFRRKTPVGTHIADFLCKEARLIVEITGPGQFQTLLARKDADFRALGYGLLRLEKEQVLRAPRSTLARIKAAASARMPG